MGKPGVGRGGAWRLLASDLGVVDAGAGAGDLGRCGRDFFATGRWVLPSYKLTVSHSHAKIVRLAKRFGLRPKDEVRIWERLLELIWERPIAALR